MLHVFSCLKIKYNSRLVFDPTYPEIDMSSLKEYAWIHFYTEAKEATPDNASSPRGKDVDMRMFVELDHAADTVTRRYITGFFIFFNMVPVVWYSKK